MVDHITLLEELYDYYKGDMKQLGADLKKVYERKSAIKATPKRDVSGKPVVIKVENLIKHYRLGKNTVQAVEDVSLEIRQSEMVALVGTSGSGKSTLLQIIGGLDKPSSGNVFVDGENITKMRDAKLSRYRGQKIGFVFQSFYLQPFLNVQSNIEIPSVFARMKRKERHERSKMLGDSVGLDDRLKHFSKEISGGQIQRAAIARALMCQPKIILADEPTGNLDQKNANAVFELFEKARELYDTTIVVVTHDEQLASKMDRVIRLSDGRIAS